MPTAESTCEPPPPPRSETAPHHFAHRNPQRLKVTSHLIRT